MGGKSLIGALRVTLGLDSAEFTKGGGKARKELSAIEKGARGLKTAMIGMIGVETLQQWKTATRSAVDMAGAIGETAQQLGVSTTALQQYEYIAGQTGMTTEAMHKSLGQLTKRLGEAAQGAKGPAKALELLDVKLRDAEGKLRSTDAVLLDIAAGMAKVKDPTIQAAIANDLFGKSGQLLLPMLTLGAEGIRQMGVDAEKSGLIISEKMIAGADGLSDSLTRLDEAAAKARAKTLLDPANVAAMENYERSMAGAELGLYQLVAAFDEFAGSTDAWTAREGKVLADWGRSWGASFAQGWQAFDGWNTRMIAWVNNTKAAFGNVASSAIASIRNLVTGVRNWLGTQLNAVFDGVKKRIDAVGGWFYDLYDKVVGHSYIPDMVDEIGVHMARLDAEMVKPTEKATTKAAEAFRALQQEVAGILARLFPEQAEANTFAAETKSLNEYYDILKKRGGDALQIERERAAAVEALQRAYAGLHRDIAGAVAGGEATAIETVLGGKSIEEMNKEVTDRFADTMGKLNHQGQITKVQVVESFEQMVDGGLRQLDRLMKGVKSGNFLDIIGGLFGLGMKLGGAGLFGKTIATNINSAKSNGSLPGLWNGGSMTLGGFSGVDRNLLSLNGEPLARVSAGETMSIAPINDRGGAGTKIFDMRGAVVTEDLLRQMNSMADDRVRVMAPGIARAGASMAIGQLRRSASRQLG